MPPKRREKENEIAKTNKPEGDHEQFLQAFEKPTQIYRYLRTRNMLKPIFLYRTLTYMKHRNSRSNKGRKNFKVDSILQTVTNRIQQQQPVSGYLTLTFLGFYNKTGLSTEDPVKVETTLLKVCHKKRKEVSCPVLTLSLGTSYVAYNPSEEFPPAKAPTVSVPTESFTLSGHSVKSYHLLLRVYTSASNVAPPVTEDIDEPAAKKRKTSSKSGDDDKPVQFGTDLVIYDKQNRCLLTDGEYEFFLDELDDTSNKVITHSLSTWEDIGFDKELQEQHISSFQKMASGPTLKFRLQWSLEPVMPLVDRPPPIIPKPPSTSLIESHNHSLRAISDKPKNSEEMTVVYQFLYNSNSKQQTEASFDMHCPWCSIDCKALYSLLKHLKLCHPRFNFQYVPVSGGVRIDISVNEGYDGSCWNQAGALCVGPRGAGPVRRTPLSHIIVCRPKRTPPHLSEFIGAEEESQRPYITGHNRLYHHTMTCLPIFPKEMELDSEDETDPRWLQKKTMMMIDEFTDVNEGEKELMKMWNLHIMKHGFVGDCQIPLACTMFLQEKGKELLMKNLYRNFVLHMSTLFDFGLVSPVTVFTTMQKVQEIIQSDESINKVLQESWAAQREHWNPAEQAPKCDPSGSPHRVQVDNGSGLRRSKPTEERGKRGRRGRRLSGGKPEGLRSKEGGSAGGGPLKEATSNKKSAP